MTRTGTPLAAMLRRRHLAAWMAGGLVILATAPVAATTPATAAERASTRHDLQRTLGQRSVTIATVRLDAEGRLTLLWARPAEAARLRTRIAELNAEPQLHLDAPPPASAPPFANTSLVVPRGDPRFIEALRQHLLRYDDLLLGPARPVPDTSAPRR